MSSLWGLTAPFRGVYSGPGSCPWSPPHISRAVPALCGPWASAPGSSDLINSSCPFSARPRPLGTSQAVTVIETPPEPHEVDAVDPTAQMKALRPGAGESPARTSGGALRKECLLSEGIPEWEFGGVKCPQVAPCCWSPPARTSCC